MMDFFTALLACSALGALGVWFCRSFAIKRGWLDLPNKRSFHSKPVPRIGGVGMLAPVILVFGLLAILPQYDLHWSFVVPLLGALLVATLSFLDDQFDLSRVVRFSVHGACAIAVLIAMQKSWVGAPIPILGSHLPILLAGFLLFFWITGLTNSYNFMDGIDGIATTQGLVAVGGWLSVYFLEPSLRGAGSEEFLLLALMGGLVGFLILNWAPASIFMGDGGSTFLGFYLAAIPLGAAAAGMPLDRALEGGVFFVWPFVTDAGLTFTKRLIRREPIFDAHKSHLYQVLAGTFSNREQGHQVTSLLFGALGIAGICIYWTSGPLWAKLAVLGWLWLALTAWTFGIRLQKKTVNANCSSTEDIPANENSTVCPTPVAFMSFEIFLSPPEITEAEHRMVLEALSSGFIAPVGPQVNAFEAGLSSYLGLEDVQAVSSGTAAIHLGLRALGVGPGDCVLCPDLTFIASVNPVRYLGAEPVLVDVRPDNWAMDAEAAREAIQTLKKEGRSVRAMVIVHAFGIPADVESLMKVARDEGVLVLEDCAGAFGARVGKLSVGSFGDAAAYSFNGNKVLTTSGGGALYIRDPKMRPEARSWANQGKKIGTTGYHHETLGYNYKLSNICAAIGIAQLETLSARLARKKEIFKVYKERLGDIPGISFLPEPVYGKNNYWLTCISVGSRERAEGLVAALRDELIEASPMWKPMQNQTINKELRTFGGSESFRIYESSLSLPSGSSLQPADLERVCTVVRDQLIIAS